MRDDSGLTYREGPFLVNSLPSLDQEEILRRISRDLADGYDEELELEIEDRLPGSGTASGAETDEERDSRQDYFRQLFRLQAELLVRSGIKLLKYWFSITDEEQYLRFLGRIHDPLKQWKLSPMDLESRRRWEDYTRAKEIGRASCRERV